MKTKLNLMLTGLVITSMLLLNSCKKDTEVGPVGATGAAGAAGNANVKNYNVTINDNQWGKTFPQLWQFEYTFPALTKAIMDSGMVIVYLKIGTFNLPSSDQYLLTIPSKYTYSTAMGSYRDIDVYGSPSFNTSTGIGKINFILVSNDTIEPQNPLTFRIVVASSHMRLANPSLNWNNYDDVKKAFNLKD